MKPTDEDFKPRRDGWFEHRGAWGEVTVGTVLASGNRTDAWEVIDSAHPPQVQFGHTLVFRIQHLVSGEQHTVQPKMVDASVTILTRDPSDTQTAPLTEPSDIEALMLLRDELGATLLATRDEATGEVTCPDYDSGANHLDEIGDGALRRGLIEHLKTCHGISDHEILSEDISMLVTFHGNAHNPKYPTVGKGGLPHRHTPEDLSLI